MTLDEFYTEGSQQDHPVRCCEGEGKAMLYFIVRFRALPDERRVYGLTLHPGFSCLERIQTGRSALWLSRLGQAKLFCRVSDAGARRSVATRLRPRRGKSRGRDCADDRER